MTDLLSVNGRNLFFGLAWVTITHAGKERKELSALVRKSQANYVVRHQGAEIKYGLLRHQPLEEVGQDEADQEPILAGALLFSNYVACDSHKENSVLILRIDENKVAMTVLLRGAPYLDMVVDDAELGAQLESLRNEGHKDLVLYGDVEGYAVEKITGRQLVSGKLSNATMHRYSDPAQKLLRIAAAIALLALLAGVAAWCWHHTVQQQALTDQTVDPAVLYEQNVCKILATANFDADAAYKTIWTVLQNREVERAGWSLKSVKCRPSQCEELWQQGKGSYAALKQHLHASQTLSLQPNNVTSVLQIALNGKKVLLERASLPSRATLWADLVSQQQRMKSIHPQLVFAPKSAELRGLTPEMPAGSVPVGSAVYSGDMTVSAPLGLAADIFRHHLDHIMISEISLEAPADVKNARVQIKGNYYAKN